MLRESRRVETHNQNGAVTTLQQDVQLKKKGSPSRNTSHPIPLNSLHILLNRKSLPIPTQRICPRNTRRRRNLQPLVARITSVANFWMPLFDTVDTFLADICFAPPADVAIDKVPPRSEADVAVSDAVSDDEWPGRRHAFFGGD
jgi:hypothetical protein